MSDLDRIRRGDRSLVQIVDAAMAESARRSGAWVRCRRGCTPCCLGPFGISALDALRLRDGLAALESSDPGRASSLKARAANYVRAIQSLVPLEFDDEDQLPGDGGWDDVPCPALDPESGACDLYAARPIPCRSFGAATRAGGAVGACELCYEGASDAEIAACAVTVDPEGREEELLFELALMAQQPPRLTLVAFALAGQPTHSPD